MLRDFDVGKGESVVKEKEGSKEMQIVVQENSFLIGMKCEEKIHNYYPFLIGLSCMFRDVYNVLRSMSLQSMVVVFLGTKTKTCCLSFRKPKADCTKWKDVSAFACLLRDFDRYKFY